MWFYLAYLQLGDGAGFRDHIEGKAFMSDRTTINGPADEATLVSFWQRVTLKQIAAGTAVAALLVAGVALVVALRYVFLLLFLSIVVATALAPLADRLRRWGLSQGLAALIVFALLLALIGAVVAAVAPFFVAQLTQAVSDLPARYAAVRETIATSRSNLARGLGAQMPVDPFQGMMSDGGVALGATLATALPWLGRGLLLSALVVFLSYYWLCYRARAVQAMALLVPLDYRADATDLWNQIEEKIGAFVRGLALLGFIIAALSAVGYLLIGLPYALTIAIIAGLLEAIPYVGPLVTMILAGLVGLSVSPGMAAAAVGIAAVMQLIESTIVVPRVMDRAVGVRPVVTLLALAVFELLFGLLGALLAVPLAAVFQVLLDRFVLRPPAPNEMDIGGRDRLALLRYQTQDLASDLRQQVRSKTVEIDEETDAAEEELEALLLDLDSLLATAQEQAA
jgi:predicted PurR-regulated permease PerM